MKNTREMRQDRAAIVERADEIVAAAEKRGHELTADEEREVADLLAVADARLREIEMAEKENEDIMSDNSGTVDSGTGTRYYDRKTKKTVRLFGPGESIREHALRESMHGGSELSAGRALRGILSGDWKNAEAEKRLMGTTGEGAIMIPAPLASEWFDLARNKAVCLTAGARVVPMESKTLSLAAVDEDPAVEWKVESEAGSGADVGLREVLLTSKTLFVGPITCSKELIYDAVNAEEILNSAMGGALAVALDKAALLGDDGGVGPSGLVNDAAVGELPGVGDLTSYLPFSLAYSQLQETNTDMANVGVVYNPSVFGTLDALIAGDNGQPLNPPRSFESLKYRLVSNQIPNDLGEGENETLAVMGDFRQMLIGSRLSMVLEASDVAGDAFEKFQVKFRGVLRADIALARPAHFVVMSGITGYTS